MVKILVSCTGNSFVEQVDDPPMYLNLYGFYVVLESNTNTDFSLKGIFNKAIKDMSLVKISSLSNVLRFACRISRIIFDSRFFKHS